MQAFQVTGFGGLEKLQANEVLVPEPGQDEVLVKIHATALNNSDIWMREGGYGTDTSASASAGWRREGIDFPRIPGSDVAGEVVKTGNGVSTDDLNKKVVLFPFQSSGEKGYEHMSNDITYIGSEFDGGYAQYVVWKADLCFERPLSNYVKSAAVPVSGLTAWHMVKRAHIQKDDKVLINGATGGVGSLATQIASKVFGSEVIAVVRDDSMKDKMLDLGATNIVTYTSDSLLEDIYQVAGGHVDVVIDVVGDALFSTSLAALGVGGRFVTSGASSGAVSEVDFRTIYLKHLNIYGSTFGTKEEFADLLKAVSNGNIKPLIDKEFPLSQAKEAQEYFKKSKRLGKVVLLPNENHNKR
ncbi:zinc-binding dehydrogenase [Geomicrobium halophilum]|nr:zinc-binding dehydrogenase [Geomicrobium halophilum]